MFRVLRSCLKPVVVAAIVLIAVFALLKLSGPADSNTALAHPAPAPVAQAVETTESESSQAQNPLILSYPAKFVCQESLRPGELYYGEYPPILKQSTNVLVHNPHSYPVTFYRKAVYARMTNQGVMTPSNWYSVTLQPDHSIQLNCDDVARMVTGNPNTTFATEYVLGVELEGYIVLAIGPQGPNQTQLGTLDVTAEYVRGSEVLKKDIVHENWWRWWWWPLPWQLGTPYERIIPISPTQNIDCYSRLYDVLEEDVRTVILSPTLQALTLAALDRGRRYDAISIGCLTTMITPSIVAKIGECRKIDTNYMEVDYVLFSNKSPLDPDPRTTGGQGAPFLFPWTPGRLYDLSVVVPQNYSVDLYSYIREWYTMRWIQAGQPEQAVREAMSFYVPYWSGLGYWFWWWNGEDSFDIGVGEGESLDVERITPSRVFMATWPPRVQ